jgi:Zn ribbon nucleic-acid-binding protein
MAMQIPSWLKPINNVDAYLCEKCGDEVRGHSAEQHVRSHEQVRVEKGR